MHSLTPGSSWVGRGSWFRGAARRLGWVLWFRGAARRPGWGLRIRYHGPSVRHHCGCFGSHRLSWASLFLVGALIGVVGGGQGGCRHKPSSSDRRGESSLRLRLPEFVPETAVGLGLADGKWLMERLAGVWKNRGWQASASKASNASLIGFLRDKFRLDVAHAGRVWVVWFPGKKAGPLIFDPVIVAQGAKYLGRWEAVLAGRGLHHLVAGLDAMDCGAAVCFGGRSSLESVAIALRGEARARANSDFWAGVLRFLASHRQGFASVMDLSGRFPAGPRLAQVALSADGGLTISLLGSSEPEETARTIRKLLRRAAKTARRHQDLPQAGLAADVLAGSSVRISGRALLIEIKGTGAVLDYFLAPGGSLSGPKG